MSSLPIWAKNNGLNHVNRKIMFYILPTMISVWRDFLFFKQVTSRYSYGNSFPQSCQKLISLDTYYNSLLHPRVRGSWLLNSFTNFMTSINWYFLLYKLLHFFLRRHMTISAISYIISINDNSIYVTLQCFWS